MKILICFICFSTNAQTENDALQPAYELEVQAKKLSSDWDREAIRRSIVLYEKAFRSWSEANNNEKASGCLREIARQELVLGNYRESISKLSEALELVNSLKLSTERVKVLSLISLVSLRSDKEEESKRYLDKSLELSKSVDDLAAQAMSFDSAAEYYYARRDLVKATDFYQKSLELWQRTDDADSQAQTLIGYGYVYMTLGEPLVGLDKAKRAELIFQEIGNKRGLALSRIAIGHLYSVMSKKQLALEAYTKAKDSFPQDIDFVEKARLLNGMGLIYEDYGEWELSLDYRKQALRLFQKDNYPYGQLATLPSLIKLCHLLRENEQATGYFTQTKQLSSRLRENYWLAIAQKQMGDFFFDELSNKEALRYYRQSLKVLHRFGLKVEAALIMDKMGMIYEREKQNALARYYYDSSLKISREIIHRFSEANTLFNLARLDIHEENYEDAFQSIKKSVRLTENITSDVSNSKLKSTYFSNVYERYELYINLLMKTYEKSAIEDYRILALQASERARARSLLETLYLTETDFTKDADAGVVGRKKEIAIMLNLKSDKLTDALSHNSDPAEIRKLGDEIRVLENELDEIDADLKQNSPEYSAIQNPAPFEIIEFRDRILDEGTILLEFSFGDDESYLWLIGKDSFSSYVLPGRERLESRIQRLRELLTSREMKQDETVEDYQLRLSEAERLYWQEAHILSNELLGQISSELSGKHLIVVPDGKLHYFPISALPFPNSEVSEPILLTNETIYEPSASTLLQQTRRNPSAASKDLLVFSDPVFSADDPRVSAQSASAAPASAVNFRFAESLSSLPRLAASKKEGDSVANIVGTSHSEVLTGFSATRERVLAPGISDYRIIHFATHGWIDEERPELSGIIMSRFDESGQKLDEFVRLRDIYGLRLTADLVVLSACKTGVGKELKGEGLKSLTNGFMQSGAGSVLSSLWKVDDNATVELMTNFYGSLVSGNVSTSRALRDAQIKMWHDPRYRSPFYWAAFTVQGDYRRTPQLTAGNRYPGSPWIIVGLALLLGTYVLYRVRAGRTRVIER